MRKLRFVTLLAIITTFTIQLELGYAADAKLSFAENGNVSLLVGRTSGETYVRVRAENLNITDKICKESPKVEDLGADGSLKTSVVFSDPQKVDQGAASCAWRFKADVKDLPVNSNQKRQARLVLGDYEQYVEYTVSNLSLSPLGVLVSPLSAQWFVWEGLADSRRAIGIVVRTSDVQVTNVRIVQAALLNNPASRQLGPDDFEVCETVDGVCGQISIDARTSRKLYLRLKPSAGDHGTYTGTISLAVNEQPEVIPLTITLRASSALGKLLGSIVLAVGVCVAWWISTWARGRSLRLEALKPVAILHDSIMTLRAELEGAPKIKGVQLGLTAKELSEVDESLTTQALDAANRLPPEIANPFYTATEYSANLQQHLALQGAKVDALMVVIRDGMSTLWNRWSEALPADIQNAMKKALIALDTVGKDAKDRTVAQQQVAVILTEFHTDIAAAGVQGDPPPLRISAPSVQYLMWEIGQLKKVTWLVWGGLSIVGGMAVLILPNMGFGSSLDYIFCFLWGFGLPTTIDKLQQIGPGGIASTIGVSLPKANS